MTTPELLATLHTHGVRVRVVGDHLRLAPVAVVTPELLAQVREHKPELLRLLATRHEVSTPAECLWCGGPLAPYVIDLAGRPALLCSSCHQWTMVGGPA